MGFDNNLFVPKKRTCKCALLLEQRCVGLITAQCRRRILRSPRTQTNKSDVVVIQNYGRAVEKLQFCSNRMYGGAMVLSGPKVNHRSECARDPMFVAEPQAPRPGRHQPAEIPRSPAGDAPCVVRGWHCIYEGLLYDGLKHLSCLAHCTRSRVRRIVLTYPC